MITLLVKFVYELLSFRLNEFDSAALAENVEVQHSDLKNDVKLL